MARIPDPSDVQQVPESNTVPSSLSQQPAPVSGSAKQGRRSRATTDRQLDKPQKQGFTGGVWIALVLGALILVMLLVFIMQNNTSADFVYLGWNFTLPLGVAMLFAAIAGMLVMALFGSVRLFKLGHQIRRFRKERESIQRTLR